MHEDLPTICDVTNPFFKEQTLIGIAALNLDTPYGVMANVVDSAQCLLFHQEYILEKALRLAQLVRIYIFMEARSFYTGQTKNLSNGSKSGHFTKTNLWSS